MRPSQPEFLGMVVNSLYMFQCNSGSNNARDIQIKGYSGKGKEERKKHFPGQERGSLEVLSLWLCSKTVISLKGEGYL